LLFKSLVYIAALHLILTGRKTILMRKQKNLLFSLAVFLIGHTYASAQLEVENGPDLDNNKTWKMNRMLEGDGDNFYAYKIGKKGGLTFIVEKYAKTELKPQFSAEIQFEEDEKRSTIEDVRYSKDKIFIFKRHNDKEAQTMTLSFKTVSSGGVVSNDWKEITTVSSDRFETVDFDIYQNPGRTKFLVKATYTASKDLPWKTDFILLDGGDNRQIWKKTVDQNLLSISSMSSLGRVFFGGGYGGGPGRTTLNPEREELGLVGMLLDDSDNIFYGISSDGKNSTEEARTYKLSLFTIEAASNKPKEVELLFPQSYTVRNVLIKKKDDEIVLGGFVKTIIKKKGRDPVKSGVFCFRINPATSTVLSQELKMFDKELLDAIGSEENDRSLRYKMDYIFDIGKDVFFVGEEYVETYVRNTNTTPGSMGNGTPGTGMNGSGVGMGRGTSSTSATWEYEYRDVLICKMNEKGKFEWIKNSPLCNLLNLPSSHIYREYIAFSTPTQIYILCNEHPKNLPLYDAPKFDQDAMKGVKGIHGSNFVCSTISTSTGVLTHSLIFQNETYCFAPIQEKNRRFMPPASCENFVMGRKGEIVIYTEDRGKDRFSHLKFK
jgi:hypothetical protein